HADGPACGVDDLSILDVELFRLRLKDRGRDREDVLLELLGRLERRLAADAGAAAGPVGAAIGRRLRVAGDDLHDLGVDAEVFGHDLTDDGLRSLTVLADADQALYFA